MKLVFQRVAALFAAAFLAGCVSVPPPAAQPPQEVDVRAAFAKFAVALAQSGFAAEPGRAVLLKPVVNRAAAQMLSEANAKSLVPLRLQEEFAEPLMTAMTSVEAFQTYFESLREEHPAAWRKLGEDFQMPTLAMPCWTSVVHRAEAGARYAATISCRLETEREDAHHARDVLVFQFRLVDLQTAEVLLTLVEKVDRGWQRGVF